MERIITTRKHLEFQDGTIKDHVFIHGCCDDIKSVPDIITEVQNKSLIPVKIEYVGKLYIVSTDFLEG